MTSSNIAKLKQKLHHTNVLIDIQSKLSLNGDTLIITGFCHPQNLKVRTNTHYIKTPYSKI